jgi:oligopeptide/dipeptide ABC transporter ATP-binding protein
VNDAPPLLDLANVSKRFVRKADLAARLLNVFGAHYVDEVVHAVDGVSLEVRKGGIVALVGESGCGKSTVGRLAANLLRPTEGVIRFKGEDTTGYGAGLSVQMIFQDPFSSLNPRKRVADLVGEAPLVHRIVRRDDLEGYVAETMERCGLDPAFSTRFPHQFSGGQRQRIGIARALAVKPEVLICDEAVSALDVSIQAQILNLFLELKDDYGLTYLFISHDLGVVRHMSDQVVVMYLGRVVEQAPTAELFKAPNHPYTRALLDGAPSINRRRQVFAPVKGEIPSPLSPPSGCHFHPRCVFSMPRCREERPTLKTVAPARLSACHLNDAT